jgi:uncharacterized protein
MRTVRIHTGYGVEGLLTDAMCKRIEMNSMLPSFREENYDEGIVAGIIEINKIFTDPDYIEELRAEVQREDDGWEVLYFLTYLFGGLAFLFTFVYHQGSQLFANSKKPKPGKFLKVRLKRWQWVLEFGVVPALIPITVNLSPAENPLLILGISLYSYFVLTVIHKRIRIGALVNEFGDDYFKITELPRHFQIYWLVIGIIFPIPMLVHYFIYLSRIRHFRNHPRSCPKCSSPLHKLDEQKDDEHLKENQVYEEELKSVDYDVWLCTNCSYKNTYTFKSKFSRYSKCPQCKTMAFYTKSRTTIVSPTYESSGSGEELELCKFCNHSKVSTYTIPKRTRSSSSGGSSGGSSSGSWGGGSSGGGGSSSSW